MSAVSERQLKLGVFAKNTDADGMGGMILQTPQMHFQWPPFAHALCFMRCSSLNA